MAFKDEGQSCIASAFRKVPAAQIEPTDLILTCPMSVRDAYNGNRWENSPQALVNLFHGLSSKVSEMEESYSNGNNFWNGWNQATVKTSGKAKLPMQSLLKARIQSFVFMYGQKVVTLGYSSVWPWITKMEAPYSSKANRVMNHLLKKFKTMLQRLSWVK